MQPSIGNPPWVSGPPDMFQGWVRKVVRLRLMRVSCRQPLPIPVADLYQDTLLKLYTTKEREIAHALSSEQYQEFLVRLVRDLTLFLAALTVVYEALNFVTASLSNLLRIRDKVKSLNPPLSIIPQSLHPVGVCIL